MITGKMDVLFIAPLAALSFAVTLIVGKALLRGLIALMERAARSARYVTTRDGKRFLVNTETASSAVVEAS